MAFTPSWTEEADAKYQQLQAAALTSLRNRQKKGKAKASKAEGLFKQAEKCVRLCLPFLLALRQQASSGFSASGSEASQGRKDCNEGAGP